MHPSFWFGLMAIVLFSVYLQWLPAGGFSDITQSLTGIAAVLDIARHLVLPTLTLALAAAPGAVVTVTARLLHAATVIAYLTPARGGEDGEVVAQGDAEAIVEPMTVTFGGADYAVRRLRVAPASLIL